jgi:hypothetical protein
VRVVLWTSVLLTALHAHASHLQDAAAVQSRAETPEEIVVRGKRLAEFRVEVEEVRERAYDIFNELNSTDDFDFECVDEPRRGSRMNRRVCVAQFEGRIQQAAAKEYIRTLKSLCPDEEGLTQRCLTDPGYASRAAAAARGAASEAMIQQDRHRQRSSASPARIPGSARLSWSSSRRASSTIRRVNAAKSENRREPRRFFS